MHRKHYIDNSELEDELKTSQLQGKMTERLAQMLYTLSRRVVMAKRWPGLNAYAREEVVSWIMLQFVRYLLSSWKPGRGNAFAYVTQAARLSALRGWQRWTGWDRRQKLARDSMMQTMSEDEICAMMQKENEPQNEE